MHILLIPLLELLDNILGLYRFVVIVYVIMSWLVGFNIINSQNRGVFIVISIVNRLVEPILYRIRKFIPNLGGIDLSPLIMILLLTFLQGVISTARLNLI